MTSAEARPHNFPSHSRKKTRTARQVASIPLCFP
jgi:hypothetical protein